MPSSHSKSAVAASSESDDIHSVVLAGMALRVKYRKTDAHGNPIKHIFRFETMGVHPKNRGGVYPNGRRCKQLGVDVIETGFSKEEIGNQFVGVE